MNWGALDYANPETQMRMIKQFEDVVATPHVADSDTKSLWIANFAIWTTRQCNANFGREDFSERRCGRDQVIDGDDDNTCSGFWMPNTLDLRLKIFKDKETCAAFEEGVCRPTSQMHPLDLAELGLDANATDAATSSWCPVFGEGWDDSKVEFCLRRWREITGGGGGLLLQDIRGTPSDCEGEYLNDERVRYPIPYSASPTMYNYGLTSHEITMEMLEETRAICDDDPVLHCFMLGGYLV
jgi:hypothetical protein